VCEGWSFPASEAGVETIAGRGEENEKKKLRGGKD
jgi:hypothetical protein